MYTTSISQVVLCNTYRTFLQVLLHGQDTRSWSASNGVLVKLYSSNEDLQRESRIMRKIARNPEAVAEVLGEVDVPEEMVAAVGVLSMGGGVSIFSNKALVFPKSDRTVLEMAQRTALDSQSFLGLASKMARGVHYIHSKGMITQK